MTEKKKTPSPAARAAGGKRKPRAAIWAAITLLIVAIAGAAAYYAYKIKDNERRETLAFEMLEHDTDPRDYEDFLRQFPTSPHAAEVRTRLASLQAMCDEWARIERHGSLADFRAFRQRYDVERYRKLCDAKIDSLDFEAARLKATPEAYDLYLLRHPEGAYYAEAMSARQSAERLSVTSEDQIAAGSAVEGFFKALGANNAEGVCAYIAPRMNVFLGHKDATKADVMNLMDKMFGPHIRSCVFAVGNDLEVAKAESADGQTSLRATVSVDQHIRRTNPGKVFGSYRAELVFNPAFQLTDVRLTEISRRNGDGEESILQKVINHLF